MTEKTIVAIGCSTDADYNFLVPITCLLWRDFIGFDPIAFLVDRDSWATKKNTAAALRALQRFGIDYEFVSQVPGYPEHTTAQNVRQHAAALTTIKDSDWVMPADADLWPLRREFYQRHVDTDFRAVLYYANGDHFRDKADVLDRASRGLRSQTIPTCHVAMRARDWRSCYGLRAGDPTGSIKATVDAWMSCRSKEDEPGMVVWMSDQQIMTEVLCQQPWFPSGALPDGPRGAVLAVHRPGHPPLDRLCRSIESRWSTSFDASRWVDAHVWKGPYTENKWATLQPIVDALLPQYSAWAKEYREEYARGML